MPLYLDDLAVGDQFTSASITVSREDIVVFARQYDPQPFHLDDAAARASVFGELVASGWHTAALTMRLLVTGDTQLAGGLIGLGGDVTWPGPVRPGDTLTVRSEIAAVVPSKSRPDRGVVTLKSETLNQAGEVVQRMSARLMVPRRPDA